MYTLEYKKNVDVFFLCLEATTNYLNLILEKKYFYPKFWLILWKNYILHLHGKPSRFIPYYYIKQVLVNEKLSTKII